ncbi:MAG: hypothetical protein ACRD2Z_02425 [Thermoanaerobaculia bacterium]
MNALEGQLAASLAAGQPVARARLATGPGAGKEMLIWPAGEVFGDLGSPRLNQRIALYVEAQFTKGWRSTATKQFQHGGETYEVEFTVHGVTSS